MVSPLPAKLTRSPLLDGVPGLSHGFTNLALTAEEREALEAATATAHQVHGDKLLWVSALEKRARQADALATFEPGLAVGAHSADCTPVLAAAVHSETNHVYGVLAAHAGWRGTALGVAGKAFTEFAREARRRDPKARFAAAVGPCIGFESFEVGPEVVEAFPRSEERGLARFLRLEGERRKYLFNLPGENLRQLREAAAAEGVPLALEALELCTVKLPGLFPSYRRDGANAGRILSFARIDSV